LAVSIIGTTTAWPATGVKIVAQSPFVTVFQRSGIAHAAGIMNFVVISAALSSMNTNIYLCSRMLFSLSRGHYAPERLGSLSGRGTPVAAVLISGACILVAAGGSVFPPNPSRHPPRVPLFAPTPRWLI